MTMVIASVLPQGAVLATDGLRRSLPPGAAPEVMDARKIYRVGDGLVVAGLGAQIASEAAVAQLRSNPAPFLSPDDLLQRLDSALARAWTDFQLDHEGQEFLSHPLCCAGLHAAGIAGGIPCAIQVTYSRVHCGNPMIAIDPYEIQIVGAPQNYSRGAVFESTLGSSGCLAVSQYTGSEPNSEVLAAAFIRASGAEILEAARVSSDVGGVIGYAWVRGGGEVEEGIWTREGTPAPLPRSG